MQSPDLNPIKNLWKVLKTNVQELYQPRSTEEMKDTLQLVWDALPEKILTNLVASIPRRIQAVIDAKGASTKW
jgi:transposase